MLKTNIVALKLIKIKFYITIKTKIFKVVNSRRVHELAEGSGSGGAAVGVAKVTLQTGIVVLSRAANEAFLQINLELDAFSPVKSSFPHGGVANLNERCTDRSTSLKLRFRRNSIARHGRRMKKACNCNTRVHAKCAGCDSRRLNHGDERSDRNWRGIKPRVQRLSSFWKFLSMPI